jgi:hypothetical protein
MRSQKGISFKSAFLTLHEVAYSLKGFCHFNCKFLLDLFQSFFKESMISQWWGYWFYCWFAREASFKDFDILSKRFFKYLQSFIVNFGIKFHFQSLNCLVNRFLIRISRKSRLSKGCVRSDWCHVACFLWVLRVI